ncbi:hypothetical protein GUITHDRAFT_153502 [Guillardia theta CCMP2712]|uniref:RWP-RK domain-containing protein n=1 Tax=Guillardia theta (strain CCMP2712) TaxID=905079 RepID=L1J2B2_GUITC|nr:hypothetical protein GUITHDRAFT_153502 [Guillardia theta CCMP2712]EKX42661.1 hypothetical protein GUITHDRAFT_153502 [Guillardia theta CCMP2712]|eukprot:XP_005829641.1 hypothetical protein GUITHDRAFT_153502 [Guillardia theta CCMP2712]
MCAHDRTDAPPSSSSSSRRSNKTSNLTLPYIQSLFVMRQKEAAALLGFSNTTMKHVCRRLGISKWPYSRVRPRASTIVAASDDERARQGVDDESEGGGGGGSDEGGEEDTGGLEGQGGLKEERGRGAWAGSRSLSTREWLEEALEHVQCERRILQSFG